MALLEISHLRKQFGNLEVLKDINLDVEEGQVIAIIGPSGSGKSTLLRCATTLEQADAGNIRYFDDWLLRTDENGEVTRATKQQLKKIRSYFGLVFQDYNLFPHFSVLRNVTEAPVCVVGQDKAAAEQNARRLLKMMGLEGKEGHYPSQLSGGQQQRVAIARALAMNPQILFFDEPTSALDPELTQEVLKVIRKLSEEHMTMVIVTHEMNFARDVADEVVFMDGGVIVERGPARETLTHPQSERLQTFLSRMNEN
ncbi:MAG: amino acid ABC transporter ATP-binding protein [Oscillospiraceae bacterium]|nr:amino acid ABC transporter ATP-binding protein [Oscillospiraceae bacterium]